MASIQDTEERLRAALADRYQIEREIGTGGMATQVSSILMRGTKMKTLNRVLLRSLALVIGTSLSSTGILSAQGGQEVSVFLAGDAIFNRKWSDFKEPEFLGLIDEIRGADVAMCNLETLIHTYQGFPCSVKTSSTLRLLTS